MCLKIILFPLGCTGSLLQRGLFSGVGEQGLLSSCGAQASRGSSLSCCGARARGRAGFSSCSSQALRHSLNSCGPQLGCSAACGTFPDQGSNPCLLHWQADSLPLSHPGSPPVLIFKVIHRFWNLRNIIKLSSYLKLKKRKVAKHLSACWGEGTARGKALKI